MNVKNKEEFARWLAEQANENLALLDGTTGPIKRLFKADIVIGVWQSPSEDFGVGYLVLKGGKLLMETIASGQEITASFATVPCQCYEQAIAAKEVFGTRDYDA